MDFQLSKSRIMSGLQCHKKLWLDVHGNFDDQPKSQYEAGNRFNEIIRKSYGEGVNLSKSKDISEATSKTKEAIKNKVKVIYEGTFIYSETIVKVDVLINRDDKWELLEAKTSKEIKPDHIKDVAIQSYILKKNSLDIEKTKLILVNDQFIYKGDNNYKNLFYEEDITKDVLSEENNISNYIQELIPITEKKSECPKIFIGTHCNKPYPCDYKKNCESELFKSGNTPYTILPYAGKKLKEYCNKNKIINLIDIPDEQLEISRKGYAENFHKIIKNCHKENKVWISDELKKILLSFEWPFIFMDFETVIQSVPLVKNTKPNEHVPFQWSVHIWNTFKDTINKKDTFSFLGFNEDELEKKFLESLISVVGKKGTIFAHNASTEKSVLEKLKIKPELKNFSNDINQIISRLCDTKKLVAENYYSPKMNGSYSIKSIVKSIPSEINYNEEENIESGTGAMLAWFICTDPSTKKEEIEKQKKMLIKYCAKDTFALFDLIKYFLNITRN